MKNLTYLIFLLSLLIQSCDSTPKHKNNGYTITGEAPGVYNGVRTYLQVMDEQRREIIKDSAIVFNEKFTFEGNVSSPELWYFAVNGLEGLLPLIIENTDFTIRVDSKNLGNSLISGSKSNDALTSYTQQIRKLSKKQNSLIIRNRELISSEDTETKSQMATQINQINRELSSFPANFVDKHRDNYFSLLLLESMINAPNTDITAMENQFKTLDADLQSSDYGKRVAANLELKKVEMSRLNILNVGQMAPDFTAPNTEGQPLALSNIRGKVTIIDFWASWCGPCRRENPNVVKTYRKYHKKGLEIIGVSLDKAGQKDRWLKAIKEDQLDWHHVSHLNYFNDPIAQLYNINSIPATYILDASGKIVAKNLRGDALDQKISELLD